MAPRASSSGSFARASSVGSEHARNEVGADLGIAQELGDEDALLDLAAVLVHLHSLGLMRDFLARGNEAGPELGGTVDEVIDAGAPRPTVRQPIVDRAPVRPGEALR